MSDSTSNFVVIGASGMLGRAWCELLDASGVSYRGLDRSLIDITEQESIRRTIDSRTHVIVNCAAYTDVDAAEEHEADALRLNGEAVGYLAQHAESIGSILIHYSTDYVFNGQASTPYPVDATHDPINAYGRTKAAGEQMIWESNADHLLIRTSWLYAPWAANFVRTMIGLTAGCDTLSVVNDQRGRPTSSQHLAKASLALLRTGQYGTFHVTDGGECTWYGLTQEIASLARHHCDVLPCASDQFPRPAKRPAYSVLDLSRTERLIGPLPEWRTNLAGVIARVDPAAAL